MSSNAFLPAFSKQRLFVALELK